jgi:hypothetical protein
LGVGVSVLLPLGARIAGNPRLARRLDPVPRFVFGGICFLLAFSRESSFFYADAMHRITGPADEPSSRFIFGALGLFLFATGIRTIVKGDYDRSDPEK